MVVKVRIISQTIQTHHWNWHFLKRNQESFKLYFSPSWKCLIKIRAIQTYLLLRICKFIVLKLLSPYYLMSHHRGKLAHSLCHVQCKVQILTLIGPKKKTKQECVCFFFFFILAIHLSLVETVLFISKGLT